MLIMILIMVFMVTGRINKQVENTIVTSTEKAVEIYNMQLDDSVTASKNASYLPFVKNGYDSFQKGESRVKLSDAISMLYKFNPALKDAILIFPDNPEKSFFILNNSTNTTYNDIRIFEKYAKDRVIQEAKVLDTGIRLIDINDRTYLVRNLMDPKFNPYAVLILELNKTSYMECMESIWGYKDAEIYVNDEILMNANELSDMKEIREIAFAEIKPGQTKYYHRNRYSYVCRQIKRNMTKITFLVRLDNEITYAQMYTVRYVFTILILFMIPLVWQVLAFFHNKVTRPIGEMVTAADAIEQGKYGTTIEKMANSDEFYYMEEAFNHMSLQLKNQFEKIYLEEIALRDAKIMALQSQINPHFLNNTLEIINWEARLNENYKVSGMIEALSTMLEATTNRKAQSVISIAEEMAYVDAYLYIIAQRFGEKFQCIKEIDESLFEVRIPRLIIQPIVENAVEHGMDITRKGKITIRIFREGAHYLKIEVEDNGILTEEEREKIDRLLWEEPNPEQEKRVSLGIRNVDQRLKIIYGAECGLFIISNKENHTVSTLLIKIDN